MCTCKGEDESGIMEGEGEGEGGGGGGGGGGEGEEVKVEEVRGRRGLTGCWRCCRT